MAEHQSLLPPSTSPLERNLERVMRHHLPVPIRQLWSIEDCPDAMLPWLGWSLGVDFWHLADTPRKRRDLIKNALAWHKKRGTPWAIKQALATLGYQVEELIEQGEYRQRWLAAGGRVLDGSWLADGTHVLRWQASLPDNSVLRRMSLGHWAEYAIRVSSEEGWSREDQAAVQHIAQRYAPARAHLTAIISNWRAHFYSHSTLQRTAYRLTLPFRNCRGLSVHQRPSLSGCWALGGDAATRTLIGWSLGQLVALNGIQPLPGFTWAKGQITLKSRLTVRTRHHLSGTQQLHHLDGAPRQLDGHWRLGERLLDGTRQLAGQLLSGAGLTHHTARPLDGWAFLEPPVRQISHRLTMTLRGGQS